MMTIAEMLAGVMSASTIEKKQVRALRALNEAYDYERPSSFSRALRLDFVIFSGASRIKVISGVRLISRIMLATEATSTPCPYA